MTEVDLTIIGGGVIGCAIAYELSKNNNGKTIALLEKNRQINGDNQSSRTSGVVHAGIYYPKSKSPLKSRFCVEGNRKVYDFSHEHKVPVMMTGKLEVATNLLEIDYLDDVIRIALENEVPGIRKIGPQEIQKLEPNVKAICAGYFPTSGIIEVTELVRKLAYLAKQNGVIFLTGTKVKNINPGKNKFEIFTEAGNSKDSFETENLVNAAGLFSDEIALMVNPDFPYQIEPFRGEAVKFYKTKRPELGMNGLNVYPVPYGFLPNGDRLNVPFDEFKRRFELGQVKKAVGIHLTPTFDLFEGEYQIGKTVTVGPAYVGGVSKNNYTQTRDEEYYLKAVEPFFPGLRLEDLVLHQAGIQARIKDHYDWVIEPDKQFPNCTHLVGIDSPGMTSSLAIAEYVREMMGWR